VKELVEEPCNNRCCKHFQLKIGSEKYKRSYLEKLIQGVEAGGGEEMLRGF
jgi:hypothetical protein